MKYCVTYRVDGRFYAFVDADSVEEAIDKSKEQYYGAIFGELRDIDGEAIIVEDAYEEGNILWEK